MIIQNTYFLFYTLLLHFLYFWVLQEVCNLAIPVSLNQFSSPNSWANAIVNRENLKLSQSPIYFKQTIQFYLWKPGRRAEGGEQRNRHRAQRVDSPSSAWHPRETFYYDAWLVSSLESARQKMTELWFLFCTKEGTLLLVSFNTQHPSRSPPPPMQLWHSWVHMNGPF